MAYEGEVLTYSPANLDFSVVYAVIVSGTFVNPCGHALLPLRRLPSPEEGSGCIDIAMSKSRLEASLFGPKNGVHLILQLPTMGTVQISGESGPTWRTTLAVRDAGERAWRLPRQSSWPRDLGPGAINDLTRLSRSLKRSAKVAPEA